MGLNRRIRSRNLGALIMRKGSHRAPFKKGVTIRDLYGVFLIMTIVEYTPKTLF